MKTKIIISLVIFCFIASGKGHSQDLFRPWNITLSYAIQSQDRRPFDFNSWATPEKTKIGFEYEYGIRLSKNFYAKKRLNFSIGAGYSIWQSSFKRPFDHNYFTHSGTLELRYVEKYIIRKLNVASSLNWNLISSPNCALRIEMPVILNYSFNKDIKSGDWREHEWKFEFSDLEIFSGLRYFHKRFNAGISYRIYNVQAIDPVIFYRIDIHEQYPTFLSKKCETINLNKIWLSAGYQF